MPQLHNGKGPAPSAGTLGLLRGPSRTPHTKKRCRRGKEYPGFVPVRQLDPKLRREHHTGVADGPCHHYTAHTMSTAGEDAFAATYLAGLPGGDVPMTTEELRDLLGAIIHGHSHRDTTDWDLNLAMSAIERHVAYRLDDFLAKQAQEQTSPSKGDQVT